MLQQVEACSSVSLLLEHDLFGKPVSTFPDHAADIKKTRHAFLRATPQAGFQIVC